MSGTQGELRRIERRNVELEGEIAALRLKLREAEDAASIARKASQEAWQYVRLLRHVPRREATP
jgi:hypothetical protein